MHRFLTAMTEYRTMQAHRAQTMFTSELSTGTAGSFPGSIKSSHLVFQTGGALFSFCWRRLFFYVKCEMRRRLQPRVRTRRMASAMHFVQRCGYRKKTHNLRFVMHSGQSVIISMTYMHFLFRIIIIMLIIGQNDRIRCRKPPPADPTLGVVLVQLLTHLPVKFCPPAPQ